MRKQRSPASLRRPVLARAKLETLLCRYVYGQPMALKKDPSLREAILYLLDVLFESGSSVAYRMRNDFVTPIG
jgi:hypothetical protein